ncbi:MAG: biosynthetic arginine decarboxylase [Planctomycetes bacterium]|nr:biosynthetic arginine decarboxylase [Planctomycetota bacterium]
MKTKNPELRAWTIRDSSELYQVSSWGDDYFSIDEKGHVTVTPAGPASQSISLFDLVEDLQRRGYELPMLLRFSDILKHRVAKLCDSFRNAIQEYGYKGRYRGVYPIKVNQQRDVVEELVHFGNPYDLGLEAGSKPELLVALAHMDNPGALIICNGYKDAKYIETALLAQKLGRYTIIVVDRYEELDTIIKVSRRFRVRPHIGVRARLSTKGAGKWVESTGDKSKFGLSASELVRVAKRLREEEMLDCLELLHFHIGSQITTIRAIKDALRESTRVFVELSKLGAAMKFIDVGGGLAVDYDGSKTSFASSTNYSLQEYANDVVFSVQSACDEHDIPHPDIVSESGRALTAHHAILVFDVLGVNEAFTGVAPPEAANHETQAIQSLYEIWKGLSRKNFQESYHDALQLKEEATSLFNLGFLDLEGRAIVETVFWAICQRILQVVNELEYVPDELEGLERALCDTYYCNFSVFQSAPDHWAVKQLFPVMPIHRLTEKPTRKGILADLTCDSDGKVDQFIDLRDVKSVLELHTVTEGKPYYLAMFLVGAYQEILGDLHNLFGDTNAIHVSLDPEHGYRIERVVEGDRVSEVLSYVQYAKQDLMKRVRDTAEYAMRRGQISMEEQALLLKRFEESLEGYTYLQQDEQEHEPYPVVLEPRAPAAAPANGQGANGNGGAHPGNGAGGRVPEPTATAPAPAATKDAGTP